MTRGEFLKEMLDKIFGSVYVEFSKIEKTEVRYTNSASYFKDCTYSDAYKKHYLNIFNHLFDDKVKTILIRKTGYNKPESIEEYHNRAIDFILSIKIDSDEVLKKCEGLKESMTAAMLKDVYQDIILKELFDLGDKKIGKARKDDDFDKSLRKITAAVRKYPRLHLKQSYKKEYEDPYFNKLIESYPFFEELNFEEDNEIVKKQLKRDGGNSALTAKYTSLIEENLVRVVEFTEYYIQNKNELAAYLDKTQIDEEYFEGLESHMDTMIIDVEGYGSILSKEQIIEFKNTAVRLYNKLYGEGHPKYEDTTYLAAWNAHKKYLFYLFRLSLLFEHLNITRKSIIKMTRCTNYWTK